MASATKKTPAKLAKAFLTIMQEQGIEPTANEMRKITAKVSETMSYNPVVAVFGKTGAGKSSLCNALFGKKIAKVSDVEACTREIQRIKVKLVEGGQGITLIDVPGIGENSKRDAKYKELYENLMPKADVILWILKGDDRAYGADLECYKKIIQPLARDNKIPIIFVLNQADKIAPSREWNIEESKPGVKQLQNINKKVAYVKEIFGHPSTRICAVAADENYGLISLVEKIVTALPAEKRYGFTREAKSENVSEAAQSNAEHGIWETVKDYASKILEKAIPIIAKAALIALWNRIKW